MGSSASTLIAIFLMDYFVRVSFKILPSCLGSGIETSMITYVIPCKTEIEAFFDYINLQNPLSSH